MSPYVVNDIFDAFPSDLVKGILLSDSSAIVSEVPSDLKNGIFKVSVTTVFEDG
jgi:hypothetical protein